MASNLLSMFGLGDSGTPFTLSDEDQQKLQQAQQLQGMLAALYGPSADGSADQTPDSSQAGDQAASDVQSANDAPTAAGVADLPAGQNLSNGPAAGPDFSDFGKILKLDDQGNEVADPAAQDSTATVPTTGLAGALAAGTPTAATDPAVPTTGLAGALAKGDTSTPASSATPDSSSGSGILSGLLGKLGNVGHNLMNLSPEAQAAWANAGATILANNRGGNTPWQAISSGLASGQDAYAKSMQLKATNTLAAQKAVDEHATSVANVAAKNEETKKAQLANTMSTSAQTYLAGVQNGTIKPSVQAALAAGVPQETAKNFGVDKWVDTVSNGKKAQVGLDASGNQITQPVQQYVEPKEVNGKLYDMNGAAGANGQPNVLVGGRTQAQTDIVNKAQEDAASATQTAQSTSNMLTQLNNTPDWSKWGAKFDDVLTGVTGNKDQAQQLRTQLIQLGNSQALGQLRGLGSASDRDVATVKAGMPANDAPRQTWLDYLGSVNRVQQAAQTYAQGKADYMNLTDGDLGKALPNDSIIAGQPYKAGQSFTDVMKGASQASNQAAAKASTPAPSKQVQQLTQYSASDRQAQLVTLAKQGNKQAQAYLDGKKISWN